MYLSVVIPAYNEEKRLPSTLQKVKEYLSSQEYDWEVLIVNDGSQDYTSKVVNDLIKDWVGFRLIDNQENRGKGAVVKQGMLAAKGDWRLFMDADNSTDLSQIEKLWKFKNNFEVIIGSRYLKADSIKIKQPLGRRIISRMGNIFVRLVLGIKSVDTQCGFKLFSREAAEKIFPLQTIKRWGFDMEILAIAIRLGYQVEEVPVDWYDAEGSRVKKGAAFGTLKEILKVKRQIIKGNYKRPK